MAKKLASLCVGLLIFLCSFSTSFAYYTNMPASVVIGQNDFTSTTSGPTQISPFNPQDVITIGNKLVLADQSGNRVLIWNQIPAQNGVPADIVLGQPDFVSNTANNGGRSARSLNAPTSIASDGTKLFVADRSNHRILIWNQIPTFTQQAADIVVGQPSFSTANTVVSVNGLNNPESVFTYGSKMFITDASNRRVLIFNQIPTTNTPSADLVLGQSDFDSRLINSGGVSAKSMSSVHATFYDGNKLYISDESNNRVLIWNSLPTSNFASADVVIGQPDFVSVNANQGGTPSANTLNVPNNIQVVNGRLYIADQLNNRVLIYNSIPTTNNAPADVVIGQPNITSSTQNNGGISSKTLNSASNVYVSNNKLFASDQTNNRILIFDNVLTGPKISIISPTALPDSRLKISGNIKLGERSHYSLQNLQAQINGEGFSDVTYRDGGRDDGADSTLYEFFHEFSPWAGNGTKDTWQSNGYTIKFKVSSNNAEEDNLFYFYPFKLTSASGNTFQIDGPKAHWQKLKDNLSSLTIKYQKSGSKDWVTLETGIKLTDSMFESTNGKITIKTSKSIPQDTSNIKIVAIDNWGHEQESNVLTLPTSSSTIGTSKHSSQNTLVLKPTPTSTPGLKETPTPIQEVQKSPNFLSNIINSIKQFFVNLFKK